MSSTALQSKNTSPKMVRASNWETFECLLRELGWSFYLVWYMYFNWSVPLITMHRWVLFWTLRPLSSVIKPYIFHMFECLLWRIKLRLSFFMLVSLFRIELDPMADSACHRRCRFRVHRRAMFLTLRPLSSVSTPNISRVWVSIVKGWARAFIWYACLSFQSRIGLGRWLRVP